MLGEVRLHRVPSRRAALARHDDEQRTLVPLRMTHSDRGGHQYIRVAAGAGLHVDRADPRATRLDHFLGAVGDVQIAVGIDCRDVAGCEPAVGVVCRASLEAEVSAAHPRAPDLELTGRHTVAGQLAPFTVDYFHVHTEYSAALER